jgi:hypothetical protein
MTELHPETLTWTALLGKWLDFARASVAAPREAEGDRWRAAVPAVINLQAVTFALADLAQLPVEDRSLARDRAELLINDNTAKLHEIWRGEEMPQSLVEISDDARVALERSAYAGAVELIWEGQQTMIMPRQVYRQLDAEGRITGDIVAPLDADLPPGMPLLVPLYEQGRPVGHFTLQAEAWEAQQRAAMAAETIPGRFVDEL